MKKIALSLCAVLACGSMMISCKNEAPANEKKSTTKAKTESAAGLPNYRYVDSDTLLAKYNLAKDYQEEMLRMQNNLDNTARQQQSAIESLAAQYQQKQQNNGYSSQAEMERDMRNLQNRQNAAQNQIGKMQNDMQTQMANAQSAVQDSIVKYVEEYNKAHGYDAIFMKAATLYIDPRLDITDEILKGLNERYNKVKK
ncbi:MAG: OmpH family outer membrane protein [Bacteroidales bacterium]|nr:OmpH family outer membrane protein [Bacteroidales bacterium]